MKRGLLLILMVVSMVANAQKKDRTDAYMYNRNGQYGKAMIAIEKCVNHAQFNSMKPSDKAQAWLYRASIYDNIAKSTDPSILGLAPDAKRLVVESVNNCYAADPTYASQEELNRFSSYFANNEINESNVISQSSVAMADKPSQSAFVSQTQKPNLIPQTAKSNQSDVDRNIPKTNSKSDDVFVLIIANENYLFLDKVKYAKNDGAMFKEYCIKTLGIPERQIRYYPDATFGIIAGGVDWLRYALENFEDSQGIVYYCGHGIPDEKTSSAFIIPIDGKGTNMVTCVSLNELYKTLAATNATRITYFMDACFTGANKEGSMLVAAHGVAIKPKPEKLEGNSVVFSASSGDETAMTYEEKQHGLFTYYLLKKLQETAGDVSYEELANYISKKVKKDAFLLNEKPQTPVVATSPAVSSSWKNMRMK